MAKQLINIGTTANDGTGDTIRVAFDKVNDNINELYPIHKDVTTQTLTGTTAETILASFEIPANTLQAGDTLVISATCSKTGTAGTLTLRCKVNSTASLSGATTVFTYLTAAANLWLKQTREVIFKTQSSQVVFPATLTALTEYGGASTAKTSLTTDYSSAQHIIISGQNSNSADTTLLEDWYLQIIRA